MQTTAEKIYETAKQLPDGFALEALHFIEYLRVRAEDRSFAQELTLAQQDSMQRTWDNAEDEIWNDAQTR